MRWAARQAAPSLPRGVLHQVLLRSDFVTLLHSAATQRQEVLSTQAQCRRTELTSSRLPHWHCAATYNISLHMSFCEVNKEKMARACVHRACVHVTSFCTQLSDVQHLATPCCQSVHHLVLVHTQC